MTREKWGTRTRPAQTQDRLRPGPVASLRGQEKRVDNVVEIARAHNLTSIVDAVGLQQNPTRAGGDPRVEVHGARGGVDHGAALAYMAAVGGVSDNHAGTVNGRRGRTRGRWQDAEIGHLASGIKEAVTDVRRQVGPADDLSGNVDGIGGAVDPTQRTEIGHLASRV